MRDWAAVYYRPCCTHQDRVESDTLQTRAEEEEIFWKSLIKGFEVFFPKGLQNIHVFERAQLWEVNDHGRLEIFY